MSTGGPSSRKTHVIRILGTNSDKEILRHMYLDIERIDEATTVSNDVNYQKEVRKFRWMDDPDDPDPANYNPKGNPNRTTTLLKVFDAKNTKDFMNPTEWVEVRVIKKIKAKKSNDNYQKKIEKLINEELNLGRGVEKQRFSFCTTNMDELAEAAFDKDPNRSVYVVKGEDYTLNLDSADESQYVETEVIMGLKHRAGVLKVENMANVDVRNIKTRLLNKYLLDLSKPAKLKELSENGFNPPFRLDPYQMIINCSWGGIAVQFYDTGFSEPR